MKYKKETLDQLRKIFGTHSVHFKQNKYRGDHYEIEYKFRHQDERKPEYQASMQLFYDIMPMLGLEPVINYGGSSATYHTDGTGPFDYCKVGCYIDQATAESPEFMNKLRHFKPEDLPERSARQFKEMHAANQKMYSDFEKISSKLQDLNRPDIQWRYLEDSDAFMTTGQVANPRAFIQTLKLGFKDVGDTELTVPPEGSGAITLPAAFCRKHMEELETLTDKFPKCLENLKPVGVQKRF